MFKQFSSVCLIAGLVLSMSCHAAIADEIIGQYLTVAMILKQSLDQSNITTRKTRKMMKQFLKVHVHKHAPSSYLWRIRLYKPFDTYQRWRDYQYCLKYNRIN